jgi:hypothetical protein
MLGITWTERCLGDGPIVWPPRSPDLTPLDFFLWGYVKTIVYRVKFNDLQHLKSRIRDAVTMVTSNMLQATWNEIKYRLDICHASQGAHIEIIEKVIHSEKTSIVSLCNAVTHKCI